MSTITRFTQIATSLDPYSLVLSADGRFLAVTNVHAPSFFFDPAVKDSLGLLQIDLEAGTARTVVSDATSATNSPTYASGITADGSKILVTSFGSIAPPADHPFTDLYVADAGGKLAVPLPQLSPDVAALSSDGNHVAVEGYGWDAAGTEIGNGIFELDMRTGALTPIAVHTPGQAVDPDPHPSAISMSADGRYVAYDSLVDRHYNTSSEKHDLFVYDAVTHLTRAVNMSSDGIVGNAASMGFSISGNGRYVVFATASTNLSADDASAGSSVFVKDLQTGALVKASTDAYGHAVQWADEGSITQGISDDGRYVVFESNADFGYKELDAPGGATSSHVFVKDLVTGAVALVNSTPETIGLNAHGAAISGDGQTIVFQGARTVDGPWVYSTYALPLPTFSPVSVNDTLKGSAGADTLVGALGDDDYTVNNVRDMVVEYANQGRDTVHATVSYTLPDNVEVLLLDGADPINGTGNGLDNVITGNAAANVLSGGAGDDLIDGGGGADIINGGQGFDTVRFAGKLDDYTIAGNDITTVQVHTTGATTSLASVEFLQFSDANVTFDVSGVAGQAYRLYVAAFDRAPDLGGLGYWISHMQNGLTLSEVANLFTQSAEFKSVFGAAPSNGSLVDLLYQHILHRAPDAAGAAYWVDLLDRHVIDTTQLLINFSESPENQAALVGLAHSGIAYHPYGG
jgi:Ca2+-binding RTX toxin-like protein